jgi:hypothetical protein
MKNIYITWDGPYTLEDLNDDEILKNEAEAYGVYQIYGHHPVYGADVLLYIGKAEQQTFAKRIKQENWEYNGDSENIKIYIGKLFDKTQPKGLEWDRLITLAEKLLIFTHSPAMNSSNINSLTKSDKIRKEIEEVRVINYDNFRSLMTEVSGDIYIQSLDWFDESKIFTAENI